MVAWAARVESPGADEVHWLQGRNPSQPQVVQVECVPALMGGRFTGLVIDCASLPGRMHAPLRAALILEVASALPVPRVPPCHPV